VNEAVSGGNGMNGDGSHDGSSPNDKHRLSAEEQRTEKNVISGRVTRNVKGALDGDEACREALFRNIHDAKADGVIGKVAAQLQLDYKDDVVVKRGQHNEVMEIVFKPSFADSGNPKVRPGKGIELNVANESIDGQTLAQLERPAIERNKKLMDQEIDRRFSPEERDKVKALNDAILHGNLDRATA
jgi:hypothetical protein